MEERVAAQAACVEVLVNPHHVARAPQMHQAMYLVDQWRRPAVAVVAHALADAFVPWAQPDFAAGALFDFWIGVGRRLFIFVRFGLAARALKNLVTLGQVVVGKAA